MKVFKKAKKKLTPLMLATLMMSPAALLSNAHANHDFKDYVGNRTIELNHDRDYNSKEQAVKNLASQLKTAKSILDQKQEAVDKAQASKKEIEKQINKLTQDTLASLQKKNALKAALPGLRAELGSLQTNVDLANAAATSTQEKVDQLNSQLTKLNAELTTTQAECTATPSDECTAKLKKIENRISNVKTKLEEASSLNTSAQEALAARKKERDAKLKEIKDSETEIANIDKENEQRATKLTEAQSKLVDAKSKLLAAQTELLPAQTTFQNTKKLHDSAESDFSDYRNKLITRIMRLNALGAEEGSISGNLDGTFLSELRGVHFGQIDGNEDGRIEGIRIGRANAYNRGFGQGEIDGRTEGNARGSKDGAEAGRIQGNTDAGEIEGRASGIEKAERSDAAQVGTGQGRTAGMERAIREGQSQGNALGETEAIQENENQRLKSGSVNGQFAGTFARRVPAYPGFNCVYRGSRRYNDDDYDWRRHSDYRVDESLCPNFIPRHPKLQRIDNAMLKQAFLDAYLSRYRQVRRLGYNDKIDRTYNNVYDNSYFASKRDFENRDYPEDMTAGHRSGYDSTFGATYRAIRERVQEETRTTFRNNPDRNATEYTQTFASTESSNYRRRYEEIRQDSFSREEAQVFKKNIEAQVEKFKRIRIGEVNGVYTNHAVLSFVGSDVNDAGINSIAANDGVFQPGETIIHDLVIRNYGKKAAENATVTLENGQTFKLPAIPALSEVKIIGAGKSAVATNTSIRSTHNTNLIVTSPLTAEARIQGRHYANSSQGKVNGGSRKALRVDYPLTLSNLTTGEELIFDKESNLSINVTNNSKRAYKGGLTVELVNNATGSIITNKFAPINELSRSTTLSDAKIKVSDARDLYASFRVKAEIKKQGVTLGVLEAPMHTMAKLNYIEKGDAPVVLLDGESNPRDLLDLLDAVGGKDKVSILDTSISKLNRDVLANGLEGKVFLALDNERGSSMKGVMAVTKNGKNNSMIFIDENSRGINIARKQPTFAGASIVPLKLNGFNKLISIVATNPITAKLNDTTVAFQSNLKSFKDLLPIAKQMTASDKELTAKLANTINKNSFFKANDDLKLLTILATVEIMNANAEYKKTESKDIERMIESGSDMLFAKIIDAANDKVNEKNLPVQLAAISMYYNIERVMDKFRPVTNELENKIEGLVQDRMRDVIKGKKGFLGFRKKGLLDALKKEEKDLYNKIHDGNEYLHMPFDVENDREDDWGFILQ